MIGKQVLKTATFDSSSLLIVTLNGELRRLFCPFKVCYIGSSAILDYGVIYSVQAVLISKEGTLVFYVLGKPFYYYNFLII